MPGYFYHPIRRREFLSHSAKALAAGVLTYGLAKSAAKAADGGDSLHLALLSDTHVAADPKNEYRKFLPAENLKLVVSQALEVRPEAVFLDGDAARLTGELEDYQAVKALLAPLAEQCPVYIGLGNHDNRENFLKVFSPPSGTAQKIAEKHVLVVEQSFLRIILLDSLLFPNKVPGLLGKAQRDWLDKYLAGADGRPTVLFVHHTLGDGDGELLDVEALYRIVQPYSKVKAIFYGHSHEYSYKQHQGIHLINLPAIGYNFTDKEPVGWVDGKFTAEGVELTLRAFGGNRQQDGKTTSLHWRDV
jgi:3',5'-cyclic-AMP phosphodiesterase